MNTGKRTYPNPRLGASAARWTAYRSLQKWQESSAFIDALLAKECEKSPISNADLRLSREIVYGVFRNRRRIDFWIDRMSKQGVESLPGPVLDILRMGLYQMAFLERTPDHAVVSEALKLCEAASFEGLKGLVNAILRNFREKREKIERELDELPNAIAVRTSHPDWLAEWALDRWGRYRATAWLEANNERPVVYLYPNIPMLKKKLKMVDRPLEGTGASAAIAEIVEGAEFIPEIGAVAVSRGTPIQELPVIRDGLAYVQDPSGRVAVDLLAPKPGETLFDVCAAPGGKTLQMASLTDGRAKIVAVDKKSKRLAKLKENLHRCEYGSVEVIQHDMTEPLAGKVPGADGVLVDAPCSGLGTLRRRVDLRYRIEPSDVASLGKLGEKILSNAARLVREGGRLVYSTCTLTDEENRDVVRGFLADQAGEGWSLMEEQTFPPWLNQGEEGLSAVDHKTDAAYAALLRKKGDF